MKNKFFKIMFVTLTLIISGCSSTSPPSYMENFGGIPLLSITKAKSELSLKDLLDKSISILPTKNTENLIPMLRKCIEDDANSLNTVMLSIVNPAIGALASEEGSRNRASFGDPVVQIAEKSIEIIRSRVQSTKVSNSLRQAIADAETQAVAVVDISSSQGCSSDGVPDDLNFKVRLLDKKMGVICDAERVVTHRQAYSATTLGFFDTNNFQTRMMQGYFDVFSKHLESSCAA